ncbi:T3SS effector NleG family protein, partial [Escherichia albertii]|nr:T3SS effector NleG family protein [Escherichia albertii]MCZ8881092.1 T3SS effector NleG family protein [Escherichia albertii]MCZ8924974.1 T3SS effector NleG family protein [Escherichia albertii]MCZ9154013.1 T3SS effector NleG family protein [Escherichia albertii]MCZ9164757.1 T3SS effector NleG family protein [Escherichia albertii]
CCRIMVIFVIEELRKYLTIRGNIVMPGLVSYISSASFSNELTELRHQVMTGQIGEIRIGEHIVRVSYESEPGSFLAEGDGRGRIYAELLNLGLNNGVDALRSRMLSVLSEIGETQQQENSSLPLLQARISECSFIVDCESFQCSAEMLQCPITLDQPVNGVFVKNSKYSSICTLFDSFAFSRLVREGSVHPLSRESITESMIMRKDECYFDSKRNAFAVI